MIPRHHYYRAGTVERGATYNWRRGYCRISSTGGRIYPWLTWREAQKDARDCGATAVFHETEEQAMAANLDDRPSRSGR